jgi:hypothetical protein
MNPTRFRSHWIEEARIALTRPAVNQFDHTVPGLVARGRRRILARLNARSAPLAAGFERAVLPAERPYVLVTLHKQPESSVDVFGNALSNQLETIRALSRIMPSGTEIWVKEHAHALGDRSPGYYGALRRMPGVRLIDPGEDTFMLMRSAALVASVSGTSCFEAAVLRIPAITFGRLFFGPILLADGVNPYAMTHHDMARLLAAGSALRNDAAQDDRIERFLAWLIAQSFEGLVSDPLSHPECVAGENVDRIARATMTLLRRTHGEARDGAEVAAA